MTAAAVMQAAEAGQLSLEAPITTAWRRRAHDNRVGGPPAGTVYTSTVAPIGSRTERPR
jgi:CubicO group peptidase (beta-lactamase class C family)